MLQTLRDNTKIILWITVVAFIGGFVFLTGSGLMNRRNTHAGTVGAVNGRKIPYQAYQSQINDLTRSFRTQNDRELTFEDERQLREQAWDRLVDQVLIDQAAARNELPLTDAEVVFWIQSNPPADVQQSPTFQDADGNFDIAKYQASLRQNPGQWVRYEQLLRRQLPADKLRQQVLASAKVSDNEIDDVVRSLTEQRVISYARIDPDAITINGDELSDAELETYYREHQDQFTTGERARLRFVRIDKLASAADEATVREDMQGYRQDVQEDLAGGLEAGRMTFAALAESFSEGPRADAGGSWGAARTRDRIRPEELAEQVFATPVGELSQPFRSDNSFYLALVESVEADSARTFSTIERRLTAGPDQLRELREQVGKLAAGASRDGLATAAAALGLEVQETTPFPEAGFVPQLLGWREPVAFAFQNQPGAIGGPDESKDAWIVYELAERLPPETIPFDQAKSSVRRQIIAARQRDAARERARKLAARVAAKGLEKGARAAKVPIQQSPRFSRRAPIPEIGFDPKLITTAFTLPADGVSDLVETDTGFYVVRVDSLISTPPEQAASQRQSARQMIEQDRRLQVFQSWLEDVRAKAKIADYRRPY